MPDLCRLEEERVAAYRRLLRARRAILVVAALGLAAWLLALHPPLRTTGPGEIGVRTNQLTGRRMHWRDGTVLVVPGLHAVRTFPVQRHVRKRPVQA